MTGLEEGSGPAAAKSKEEDARDAQHPPQSDQGAAAAAEAQAFALLRARKIETIEALAAQVRDARARLRVVLGELRHDDAADTVRLHIRRLHAYNEIRDVGLGLLGMIAERRGVRVRELFAEFGVGVED